MRKRVVVAMSGGVDSSTVAAILHAEGYEVIGITLQLYDYGKFVGKKGACCAGQDIYDAQQAAEKIGIPHYVMNYESVFKEEVVEDFVDSYLNGETPLPCVKCNQKVKFRDLFRVAKELNADALATGHYVRKIVIAGERQLHKGADQKKDQSYFLFTTTQEQLDFVEFPIGHLTKEETREIARSYDLNVANKPDSQDICFVPNGKYSEIVEKLRPEAFCPGDIILQNGTIVGHHTGIARYTIGQRRRIGVANSEPLYVLKIDPVANQVIVGTRRELGKVSFKIKEMNWLIPEQSLECTVKLRSMHSGSEASIKLLAEGGAEVTLDEAYDGVSPGQACVMYQETRLIGGGWIARD